MRKVTVIMIVFVAILAFAGTGFAGETKPAAQPAPESSKEGGEKGGCMPGGGCCGACQKAAGEGMQSGAEKKAAAADPADCPCKRRQKAL